ncbi:hypothetical protein ACS0TY_010817 [Phlomoides rotata]
MRVCMTDINRIGAVLLLLLAALSFFSGHSVRSDDCGGAEVQWQILTKLNYSTQIRLHPRLLLLVTVPWSGESRSLMKVLAHVVASDEVRFGTLKLMVLYINMERMLADALGATEGITVFYYHNAVSYKYWGRLRVQNILASVEYVTSLSPDELPLKSLSTSEELKGFLHSTDKAVLLLEFCGWTPRLLATNKSTESDLGKGYLGTDFNRWNNETLMEEEKDNRKDMENNMLSCSNDDVFNRVPLPNQFTAVNNSLAKEAETLTVNAGESCPSYEFQQFEVFFQKLITSAREFFLPPERFRYAMVRDRSLLPLLNIEEPSSWLVTVQFSGCPSCSQILKDVDELRSILLSQPSPVSVLEDDPHGAEVALPAQRPSMLLFVDRSSDSMEIRRESQEALSAFRELAKLSEMANPIRVQANMRPDKTIENSQASLRLKHPRLQAFASSENIVVKDKMSVLIFNEGQQVTLENLVPELQGRSVHEILNYALKQKKEIKLSSLAKDVGFQLLSQDFNVEVVESLPSPSANQPNQVLGDAPVEDGHEGSDINKKQLQEVPPNPSDVEHIMLEGKKDSLDINSLSSSVEHEHDDHTTSIINDSAQGWNVGGTRPTGKDYSEPMKIFTVSFFYLDGQYRLLETLTGGSKIPSVVIVDPISQEHYLLDDQPVFSSLSMFVNDFLAGKLHPYLQSVSVVPISRNPQKPPFVNQDFHETDSIPLVTTRTFADLVIGSKFDPRNSSNPWDRNVLVLFSNSWCGFCQRVELVVREVYRAVKGYANMKTNSSMKEKLMLMGDAMLKLPLIYMMDCTRNDCSFIIKPILQREVYPVLLLFPAERKNNSVSYEGDIAVSDIIKFLAAHGCDVVDLIMNKGFAQEQNSVTEGLQTRSFHHEVVLKHQQNAAPKYKIDAQLPVGLHEKLHLFPGCVLSATEMLVDVHPFDESKILIVKADEITGFRGLIINKHIRWDSLEDLDQGFELLKEAPLSFGGPVVMRGMPLAALTHKSIEDQSDEILPNVYYIGPPATHSLLEEIRAGNQSVHDFWFFLGYSNWGWEQLFHEIAQGAWKVSKGDLERLEWPWR